MVKATDDYLQNKAAFAAAKISVPGYDQQEMITKTLKSPKWIHFGGGNLFRAFHAAIADELLQNGASDTGVIVAETYDDAVIDNIYNKYDDSSSCYKGRRFTRS